MYDWFQENDILSYFHAFPNKGCDDLEVLVIEQSLKMCSQQNFQQRNLLGQRKKVALAVPKSKLRKSRGLVITLELERNKALGKPWKKKSLGYIPSSKGERSKA